MILCAELGGRSRPRRCRMIPCAELGGSSTTVLAESTDNKLSVNEREQEVGAALQFDFRQSFS